MWWSIYREMRDQEISGVSYMLHLKTNK